MHKLFFYFQALNKTGYTIKLPLGFDFSTKNQIQKSLQAQLSVTSSAVERSHFTNEICFRSKWQL